MKIALLLAALSITVPVVVTAASATHAQALAPAPSRVIAMAASLEKGSTGLSQASMLAYPADAAKSHKGEWIELQSWSMGAATQTAVLAAKIKASAAGATPQERAALLDEANALVASLQASLAAKKPESPVAKRRHEMLMRVVSHMKD